jgi:hypothetical protein
MVRRTDIVLTDSTNDPGHWQKRAEELRAIAEEMISEDAKAMVLRIAGNYDGVARRLLGIEPEPSKPTFDPSGLFQPPPSRRCRA